MSIDKEDSSIHSNFHTINTKDTIDTKDEPLVSTKEVSRNSRAQAHYQATTKEEKALDKVVNLKIDFILLTLLAANFLFAGIDRSNIGNAATTSFVKDANLKPDDIGNAVSLISATFVPLQPFGSIAARRLGPKYMIPCSMILCGVISMSHAAIKNRQHLFALRLLLGAAECGSIQPTYNYITTLYPQYNVGFRLGLFSAMFAAAGAFSGLLAYGCFHIQSSKYHDWQLLFLIEGGLSLLVGIVSLFIIPSRLETAWFLSPAERVHAARRIQIDIGIDPDAAGNDKRSSRKVSWRDVRDAVTDWKKILIVVCNMLAILPVDAFSSFLPLIVHGMGYSGLKANLMVVSPFFCAGIGIMLFTYSSDHFRDRSIHLIVSLIFAIIGLLIMIISSNPRLRYGFTHIFLGGAFTGGPLIIAWLSNLTPQEGTRTVILGMNGFGTLASVISGQLFKAKYAPSYHYPLIVTIILIGVNGLMIMSIRGLYIWENRRRKKKIEGWSEEMLLEERRSEVRRGDQKLTFAYGY